MKEHKEDCQNQSSKDFLSEVSKDEVREHTLQVEHHANQFWKHGYYGERPFGVLRNRPVSEHEYSSSDPCAEMKALMKKPEFAELIPEMDEMGEPIFKAIAAAKGRWVTRMWIAEVAARKANYIEAERNFREALLQTDQFDDSKSERAKTLIGLAESLCAQGKVEEGEELFLRAAELDVTLMKKERRDLANDFNLIAGHYLSIGHYSEAEALYCRVLEEWKKLLQPDDPLIARCLNDLAIIYGFENNWQKAEQTFEDALNILEKEPERHKYEMAFTLQNLGNVCALTDRPEKAADLYARALTCLQEMSLTADEEDEQDLREEQVVQHRIMQTRLG
jgi:hypothetical protein